MINSESFRKRERFEQSLRRSGWDESSITYEWYKVLETDIEYKMYAKDSEQVTGFFSASNYLNLKGMGV